MEHRFLAKAISEYIATGKIRVVEAECRDTESTDEDMDLLGTSKLEVVLPKPLQ